MVFRKQQKSHFFHVYVNIFNTYNIFYQELAPYLHAVWYSFYQIAIALYFLWGQMGISSLAGISVILLLIPLTGKNNIKIIFLNCYVITNKKLLFCVCFCFCFCFVFFIVLFFYFFIFLFVYYLFFYLLLSMFFYLFVYFFIYLFIYLFTYSFIY